MSRPSIPQGTRDFGPEVVRKRNYIFQTIRSVFELYGYQPLETPAMENLDTLMGKYGDEGDKLIFKILNNGLSDPKNQEKAKTAFAKLMDGKNDRDLTERALKYDLTIPFARYVAMNHGQLTFPFKRYQIQPVWRADKPQKGRYREFFQCDADVVGSKSLLNEAELAGIYQEVFARLGINVQIRINSRKILGALAELCGSSDKMVSITVAIDKLDKIGLEKVKEELASKGLLEEQVAVIEKYLQITGNNEEKINSIKQLFGNNETARNGIEEIEYVLKSQTSDINIHADFTLARGLNYYTGIIFEVKAESVQMGSIGGGGRYDDLTGLFGVPNIPGVGISFGVDRIYDVMEELKLFPEDAFTGTRVLFFNLGEEESQHAMRLMKQLRSRNISCELFHESSKFDKQFKYAERKNIPYVIIMGTKEIETGTFQVKDIRKGAQQTLTIGELSSYSFE
jgi:histidyl-tRNA synthetase